MNSPIEILDRGRRLLNPILESNGFTWVQGKSGHSSGGRFACGEYVRKHRRLEIHVRHSLGLVNYHVKDQLVEHAAYMRVLLGPAGGNQYPGFSKDPLDAFRHLAFDLSHFCNAFLVGPDKAFKRIAERVEADLKITGFKRLP